MPTADVGCPVAQLGGQLSGAESDGTVVAARPVVAIRRAGLGAEKLSFASTCLGSRPTFQATDQRRSRSGPAEILLKLMANGADSDNVATHFKCSNEPSVSEGNDEFTLVVIQGASGLAA